MTRQFDISDVPTVSAAAMEAMVDLLVSNGRARAFFNGHDATLRATVEGEFWAAFDGPTGEGVATLVRFWALIDSMAARRVSRLLFAEGFSVLKPLARSAAKLRLNATWGFAPQRLLWAVAEAQSEISRYVSRDRVRVAGPLTKVRETECVAA